MPSTMRVPAILAASSENLEPLYDMLADIEKSRPLRLDMSQVHWIHPSGLTSLLLFARYARELTHSKVCLFGCQDSVLAYLERVNMFDAGSEWLFTNDRVNPDSELGRSDSSTSVLELKAIRNSEDVRQIADRTRGIVREWLPRASKQQNDLIQILSEVCGNICEHSHDIGHIAIQRYRRVRFGLTEVRISVSDMGIGIRKSLIQRHGEFADLSCDYIQAALKGRSSRGKNIVGNGFQKVQEIIVRGHGTLYVRSENGGVRSKNQTMHVFSHSAIVPGTQVAITFTQPSAS
jgi:anti-anti-sigma regulatory factor